MNHMLIAVTEGDLAWDETAGDLDWVVTSALSKEALGHAFSEEPRWVDLRWARDRQAACGLRTRACRTRWPTWPRRSGTCRRTP